jgi:hypothetical protein
MYVRFYLHGYIEFSIYGFVKLFLDSLGDARSAQHNVGSFVASARSAHLNLSVKFKGERAKRVHQDSLGTQGKPQGY